MVGAHTWEKHTRPVAARRQGHGHAQLKANGSMCMTRSVAAEIKGVAEEQNRKSLTCDNLDDETGQGHFIKFTFNNIGLIDSVTYMGHEEIILQMCN